MQNRFLTHNMNHDMICNDRLCHEGINTPICNDHVMSKGMLEKSEWWFLVTTLEKWGVFNPRAVIKKNPAIAWRVMNLCKDPSVRVKGAYFTTCFKRELIKEEIKQRLSA